MTSTRPAVHLALEGDFYVQLGSNGVAGAMPRLNIRMNDVTNAATLNFSGYDSTSGQFDLPTALEGGVFTLYDAEEETQINIPFSSHEPGRLVIPAGAAPQWFDLRISGQDKFWEALLKPDHKYHVRWQDGPNAPWSYSGRDDQDAPDRQPISHFDSRIEFKTFGDDSIQPEMSIALVPTASTCHLNGKPQFGFKLSITSYDKDLVTICFDKTPLRALVSVGDIAYTINESGEEVEWPETFACWGKDDPFPPKSSFEELKPGSPHIRTFWLKNRDESTSNGGELETLEPGHTYTVAVGKTLIETAFISWLRGSKEELLSGSFKEMKARWNVDNGPIMLEVSEPFKFETV